MPEMDPSKVIIPTVETEAFNLPLSSWELGRLQGILEKYKRHNPIEAMKPEFVRLETKLAFQVMLIMAFGEKPEMREVGRQAVEQLHAMLTLQKAEMESRAGK